MASALSTFTAFVSKEVSAAEAAIGPSLSSVGTVLTELEGALNAAITNSNFASEASDVINPLIQVLVGSLSSFLGTGAAPLEAIIQAGVDSIIASKLPAAPAPKAPVSPPSIVA